jgi:hypothetical protein
MQPNRLPQQIGEYELVRGIARGGMGAVFEVKSARSGATYAAKTILKPGDSSARERFKREAELLARCDRHPGIVKIHAIGEDRGVLYMILDLVRGEDLAAVLRREEKLEPARAARIIRDTARALAFVHALGVVHRDVKPENILLDEKGTPRLTDFGVATATDLERLTRSGAIVGTPRWISPEQAGGLPVTPATDIFALGCILFRAVSGEFVLEGEDAMGYFALVGGPLPLRDVRDVDQGIPAPLAAIIARALSKSPGERYPSAEALAADLDAFLERKPLAAGGEPRAKRLPFVLGALAVLGVALALVLGLRGGTETKAAAPAEDELCARAAHASPQETVEILKDARSEKARLLRARAFAALGRGADALHDLAGLPETTALLEVRGDAAMLEKDFALADKSYTSALHDEPTLIMKRVEAAALASDSAVAFQDLDLLLKSQRNSKDPRLAPALYLRAIERPAKPKEDLDRAFALAPPPPSFTKAVARVLADDAGKRASAWATRIMAHLDMNREDEKSLHAIYGDLVRASRLDPGVSRSGFAPLITLLRFLCQNRDPKLLLRFAQEFLDDWPDQPIWLYVKAYSLSQVAPPDWPESMRTYEKAVDNFAGPPREDDDTDVKDFAGHIASEMLKIHEREPSVPVDLDRVEKMVARSLDPNRWLDLARQAIDQGQAERARRALEQARAGHGPRAPEEAELVYVEANILVVEGKKPEGRALLPRLEALGFTGDRMEKLRRRLR